MSVAGVGSVTTVDVSIVVVSFNTCELLARCLASLPAAAGELSWQAIVVDNASRDGSVAMVRERFPEVECHAMADNLGFARGTNLGMARATGRLRVWLNPDCEMTPGSLVALVCHLEQHPEAGAVGPRLIHDDGRVQPSAQAFPSGSRMLYHFLGLRSVARIAWLRSVLLRLAPPSAKMTRAYLAALDPGIEPREVDWVSGACLATRAEVASRVGPIDETYFMYCEDTDWCHRVHAAGWRVHYLPGATVIHRAGASHPSNPLAAYYYYGSLVRYFLRYRPDQFAALRVLMLVAFALRGLGGELKRVLGRGADHPWWRLVALCWSLDRLAETRA